MLMSHLASVVIREFHIVGIAIDEPETNAPLIINGDGMLSLPVPLQFVKPIAGRDLKIL